MNDTKRTAAPKKRGVRYGVSAGIIILLCAVLFAGAMRLGCSRESNVESRAALGAHIWSEELPLTRVLLLFYPEAGGGKLRAEARRFAAGHGTSELMKSALSELGRGPDDPGLTSPFKREISVRGVYSQEDGTLYVDLGAGSEAVFGSGLSEEAAAIGAIANTLFYNFPHVSRLRILIDGEPVGSLGGHIDLSGFLYPEEWLQTSDVAL